MSERKPIVWYRLQGDSHYHHVNGCRPTPPDNVKLGSGSGKTFDLSQLCPDCVALNPRPVATPGEPVESWFRAGHLHDAVWHHDDGCGEKPASHAPRRVEPPDGATRCPECIEQLGPKYAGGAWFPFYDDVCAKPGEYWHCYSDCDRLPRPHDVPRAWVELPTDRGTLVCGTCHVRRGGTPAPWFRLPGGEWHHVDGCGAERQLGGRESYSTPPTGATCTTCAAGLPPEPRRTGPEHGWWYQVLPSYKGPSVDCRRGSPDHVAVWHHDDGCGARASDRTSRREQPPVEDKATAHCSKCIRIVGAVPAVALPSCPYCATGDKPDDGSHKLLNVPCGPEAALAPLVRLALEKQWQRVAAAITRQLTGDGSINKGVTDALLAAAAVYRDEGVTDGG